MQDLGLGAADKARGQRVGPVGLGVEGVSQSRTNFTLRTVMRCIAVATQPALDFLASPSRPDLRSLSAVLPIPSALSMSSSKKTTAIDSQPTNLTD